MTFCTIVIPVHNGEETLAVAIDSALAQTYGAFEVLVVDDGSTDRSAEIVRGYADPRLRLYRQPNGGLNSARNAGIREGRGDYIGLLDADDLWEPTKLARHAAHLDADPGIGLSFSGSWMMGPDGTPTGMGQTPQVTGITPLILVTRNPVGNGSTPLMRAEALDSIAHPHPTGKHADTCWFDEELRQSTDIECWLRLALQTDWRIEGIAEPLTGYRLNPHGLSANTRRQLETWTQMIEKTAAYAPDFIAEHGALARAYQLRYLARRAVSLREPALAWGYAVGSLRAAPRIVLEQPVKTVTTLGAALVLRVGGRRAYSAIESLLLGVAKRAAALARPASPRPASTERKIA